MSYAGQNILVLGLGRSGMAAVQLLRRQGAAVSAYDRDRTRLDALEPAVEGLSGPELPSNGSYRTTVNMP